jgi:hypothetical protein
MTETDESGGQDIRPFVYKTLPELDGFGLTIVPFES